METLFLEIVQRFLMAQKLFDLLHIENKDVQIPFSSDLWILLPQGSGGCVVGF